MVGPRELGSGSCLRIAFGAEKYHPDIFLESIRLDSYEQTINLKLAHALEAASDFEGAYKGHM